MKPFLLLCSRPEPQAAEEEYAAFLRFSGLGPDDLHRVRMEQGPLGPVDLASYSGVVLGGSPFTVSDPQDGKSSVQVRVEREIAELLDDVVAGDVPFLGACYGIGTLGTHQGGVVDRSWPEPIGPTVVSLTEEGRADPLLGVLPETFEAFVGHKEAISRLPVGAVHLATSGPCPVQAFRVRRNVYATQFHPELDVPGIQTRIETYKHMGYFEVDQAEVFKAAAAASNVVHPPAVLRRFVELYAAG